MDSLHRLFLFLERRIRMKKNWQSESLDMDQLFPGGYVIELETGRYLNNCNGKKYEVLLLTGQSIFQTSNK